MPKWCEMGSLVLDGSPKLFKQPKWCEMLSSPDVLPFALSKGLELRPR